MASTYTILGGDGNQYGPVTAEQFRAWAQEGRVNGSTQVRPGDAAGWVNASSVPELAVDGSATFAAATPAAMAQPYGVPSSAPVDVNVDPQAQAMIRSGAGWFFWIAAFSVINSILVAFGAEWSFALGLGVTQTLDYIGKGMGGMGQIIVAGISIVVAGVIASFGYFAGRRHGWAFIVGMILLALDTALVGILQLFISLAIHAFALFCIFRGYKAHRATV